MSIDGFRRGPMVDSTVLMVAGHSVGKSAFCRLLLESSEISPSTSSEQRSSIAKFALGCGASTSYIRAAAINIVDPVSPSSAAFVPLTVIDTPGISFGPNGNSTVVDEILRHVEARLAIGLDSSHHHAGQQFVHLCLYFIDPALVKTSGTSGPLNESIIMDAGQAHLPAFDIDNIKQLSARMNVLPVVGMADTLTDARLAVVKLAIRRDLAEVGIGFGIFDDPMPTLPGFGNTNGYPPDPATNGSRKMPSLQSLLSPPSPEEAGLRGAPYALLSPEEYSHSDGVVHVPPAPHDLTRYYSSLLPNSKVARGKFTRNYRWGSIDVLDPKHSDFLALKSAIFFHMKTLRQYTIDYLFEKFSTSQGVMLQNSPPASQDYPTYPPVSVTNYSFSNGQDTAGRPRLTVDTPSSHSLASSPGSIIDTVHVNGASPHSLAPPSPQTSKRRARKVSIACDLCRSRKLKCDGVRPACGQCSKRANPCEYVSQHKRRRGSGRAKPPKPSHQSDSESIGERSVDEMSMSHSPEALSRPMSRMSSSLELSKSTGRLTMAESNLLRSQPFGRPHALSVSSDQLYTHRQHHDYGISRNNGLSHPASPTTTSNSNHLPLPIPQRKRSSTVPNRHSAGSRLSNSGPKIIACNFCRARKTKCDGNSPSCASCARRSISCVYNMSSSQTLDPTPNVAQVSPATTPSMTASGSSTGYGGRYQDQQDYSSSSRPSSGSSELEIKRKSPVHLPGDLENHIFQKRMRIDEEEESPFSHDSYMD